MQKVVELAKLIKEKNKIENNIASIIGRPALIGHTGEYIASAIYDIELEQSANSGGYDGRFTKGELTGKTVNVKWYPKNQKILDIRKNILPDYFLVLTGPNFPAESSRNKTRPWVITSVYFFKATEIVESLERRGVKIGDGTSLIKEFWDKAEVYSVEKNYFSKILPISEKQKEALKLFSS